MNPLATASWGVSNGVAQFRVASGGTSLSDIQFVEGGVTLVQGKPYVLQFDAWSSQPTYIGVQLAQSVPPYLDYSQLPPPFLTPNPAHFRYVFTMQQPSDFSADVLFELGAATGNVSLSNISLFTPAVGDLNQDGQVDFPDLSILTGNWLEQQPGLPGDLNQDGKVDFNDFVILGQNWSGNGP